MSILNIVSMTTLGTFDIETGKVIMSDPCYDKGTWCSAGIDGVKNGTYTAAVIMSDEGSWGIRVKELHAYHETLDFPGEIDPVWEELGDSIGVDSGQAGIFDEKYYDSDELIPENYTYTVTNLRHEKGYMCTDGVVRTHRALRTLVNSMSHTDLLQHKLCTEAPFGDFKEIVDSIGKGEDINVFYFITLGHLGHHKEDELIVTRDETTITINKDSEPKYGNTLWYNMCCDNTLSEKSAGVIPFGCVSSSGYGDGGYVGYVTKKGDEIVGFKIVYIGDEEEDEDF